jgi:hypothetical protein
LIGPGFQLRKFCINSRARMLGSVIGHFASLVSLYMQEQRFADGTCHLNRRSIILCPDFQGNLELALPNLPQ